MSTEHGKWQPMESAPKDGTRVLVLIDQVGTRGRSVWTARWDDSRYAKKPRPYWSWDWKGADVQEMRNNPPIAWMPLPPTEIGSIEAQAGEEPHEHTAASRISFHCEMAGNSADEDFALGELLGMSTAELQELSQSDLDDVIRPVFDDWQGTQVSGGWEIE
jgi:hypothetical protein